MISVIIPTYNEASNIEGLILILKKNGGSFLLEIIVSDGGSSDATIALAAKAGAVVYTSPGKGRAAQMNHAVSKSSGNILYFVHADTIPPASFASDITTAVQEGYQAGRYRTRFLSERFLLKLNAFFTSFDMFMCYGGDQTFFITKKLFNSLNGYDISKIIMEDYDITIRAKEKARYKIFDKPTLISARKYELNSWLRVQRANYKAVQDYKKGVATSKIAENYKKALRSRS